MNPDEAWIGKVMAAGAIGLALWGITALLQAKSEVARRVRIVLGVAVVLIALTAVGDEGGPVAVGLALAILGAGYWIFSGSKK